MGLLGMSYVGHSESFKHILVTIRCSWTSCFKNKEFQLGEILRHILEKWNDIESTKVGR